MKPINSRNFGPAAGRIRVSFHNGTTAVNGHILRQVGTDTFVVTDGTTTRRSRLAQSTATATTLTDGFMTVQAAVTGTGAVLNPVYEVLTTAVNTGGTGYSVNDLLTVPVPGTGISALVIVTTVSSGVITGVAPTGAGTNRGEFLSFPGTLVTNVRRTAVTGGAGTGAILDVTFRVKRIDIVSSGTDYAVGQALAFTGVGAGTPPAATIATVTADGGIATFTVSQVGVNIFTPATSVGFASRTAYVKRMLGHRCVTTAGTAYAWDLTTAAAAPGVAGINTI